MLNLLRLIPESSDDPVYMLLPLIIGTLFKRIEVFYCFCVHRSRLLPKQCTDEKVRGERSFYDSVGWQEAKGHDSQSLS